MPPARPGAAALADQWRPAPGEPGRAASLGIKLVDAPVSRRDDPRAHVYIVDHVSPGDTVERRVAVTNRSSRPRKVALYPGAASVAESGFSFAAGRTGNELTSWIRLEHAELELAAGERQLVWVTIEVPRSAPAGERYGVVWAETSADAEPSDNVQHVGRVGVRIYLSVGRGKEPASDFEIDQLDGGYAANAQPVVTALVRNTGERALDLQGKLVLSDGPAGLSMGPVEVRHGAVAVGGRVTVRAPLDADLPDGAWTARLILFSGRVKREATGVVEFGVPPDRASGHRAQAFLGIGGAVSLLAVALLGVRAYRGRRET